MSDGLDMELEGGEELEFQDPVFPSEEVKEQLISYLRSEYEDIDESEERQELKEDWEEYRRVTMVKPKERNKSYPWEGAANVVTPFSLSNVNGVFAHLKSAIAEKRPRWSVTAGDDEWTEHAKCLQEWINKLMLSKLHMNISEKDEAIMFDLPRLGTQFVDVVWRTKWSQFKRRGPAGGPPEVVNVVTYDGPDIEIPRLEDSFIRSHWTIQDAPYVMFRHHFTKQDLDLLEYSGFFDGVEDMMSSHPSLEESRAAEREQLGVDANSYEDLTSVGAPFDVLKAYVRWDADEDGMPEDLITWFEPDSGTMLRSEWNELSKRPVSVGTYLKLPGLIYGLGVCGILYTLQEEIDSMHNIGINSLHVSSLQMYVTPRGAGIGEDEPFFPLKNLQVDDPARDFQIVKFPNVSNETSAREQIAQSYGRTATGISEGQLGMPDTTAKSGTSPTLQQFLAEQGNKILRSVIQTVAELYSEIGQHVLLQLVANSDRVLSGNQPLMQLVPEDKREYVEEVLRMGVEDIPQMFHFSVKTTEADKTDDAQRQMLMMKSQLYLTYFQQGMETAQMLDNPQMQQMPHFMEFVSQGYVTLTKLMEESLRLFDTEKPEDYLVNTEMEEVMLAMTDMMKGQQAAQLRQRLEEAQSGNVGQRVAAEAEGAGVYEPGYTAGEGAGGPAPNEGAAEMGQGQGGRPNNGPPAQSGPAGPAGPRPGG